MSIQQLYSEAQQLSSSKLRMTLFNISTIEVIIYAVKEFLIRNPKKILVQKNWMRFLPHLF